MALATGRLEVGDRGCALDERRGVAMPCAVVQASPMGRQGVVRFALDRRRAVVWVEDFYFEVDAS